MVGLTLGEITKKPIKTKLLGLCACGCGEEVVLVDAKGRQRKWKKGHHFKKDVKRTEFINFVITPAEREKLYEKAKSENLSVAAFIRKALYNEYSRTL